MESHSGGAEGQIQPDDKSLLLSDTLVSSNRTMQGRGEGPTQSISYKGEN